MRREGNRQIEHIKTLFYKSIVKFKRNKVNLEVPQVENQKPKSKQKLIQLLGRDVAIYSRS